MQPLVYLFCLALCPFVSIAQEIDSLKKLNDAAVRDNNHEHAAYYTSLIAYHWFEQKAHAPAITHFHQVLKFEGRIKNSALIANALNTLGAIYAHRDEIDSSIYFYREALTRYTALGDTLEMLTVRSNLAIQFRDIGLYDEALETSFSSIEVLQNKKPDRILASFFNTIASTYQRIGEFSKARKYFLEALAVREQLGLVKPVSQSYNNIGETFIQEKKYDSALIHLVKSLNIKEREKDVLSLPVVLANLGLVHLRLQNFVNAESFLSHSAQLHEKNHDRLGQVVSLNYLGEVYLETGNLDKARYVLDQAESLVREVGALEQLNDNLLLKIRLHKAALEMEKAIHYAEELRAVGDSLFAREKIRSMISADVRYQSKKKDQQILQSHERTQTVQARLATRQTQVKALGIGALSLLMITAFVLYRMRMEKQKKTKKDLLLRELQHRVRNNLQMLGGVLSLQSNQLRDEKISEFARSYESRLNAMALIHNQLNFAGEETLISCKEYLEALVKSLVNSFAFGLKPLKLDLDFSDIELEVDKLVSIGLIVNELVSNSFKHAFADNQSPELQVCLRPGNGKNTVILQVRDNGPGFSDVGQPSSEGGFGLRMIKMLGKQLKGSVNFYSDHGTCFELHIPISR
jgi:two-component system, sensor histidine kinase PdtaS